MKKQLIKAIQSLVFLVMILPVQAQYNWCGIYEMEQQAILEDPGILVRRAKLEAFTKEFVQQRRLIEQHYIIPVVFHIMHDYGEENISNEQIWDVVRIMNEDFNLQNSDTSVIIQDFKEVAGNSNIEFRLAKLDDDMNCTDGIVRYATQQTYSASDNIKDLSRWPREKYLNIWVVKDIASGAAGYSYYPGVGQDRDGIVVRHNYVGSIGTGNYTRSRTLTHEAGHYLNLMHPWGNSNDPGVSTNCGNTDEVPDTPETIGNTACQLYHSSCGSLDNVQNYMEYSYCSRMFTSGQGERMHAALEFGEIERYNLWQEYNLLATGVHDSYQALPCTPVADFGVDTKFGCAGMTVMYLNNSFNGEIGDLEWSFPGGNPSSSIEINPMVTYVNPGDYTASLKVFNQVGEDSIIKFNLVHVVAEDTSVSIPFIEGFEYSDFPLMEVNPDLSWYVIGDGDGAVSWSRTVTASSTGNASLKLSNRDNMRGASNVLISPAIMVPENIESLHLSFKYAYAQWNDNSDDELEVRISNDCGESWQMRYIKSGYFLSTNSEGPTNGEFIPALDEWRVVERDILGNIGSANSFLLKFECTSDRGNNLYLDDIHITGTVGIENIDPIGFDISIYPNPMSDNGKLLIVAKEPGEAVFSIVNVEGKIVNQRELELQSGENQFNVIANLPAGVYTAIIQNDKDRVLKRFVVLK